MPYCNLDDFCYFSCFWGDSYLERVRLLFIFVHLSFIFIHVDVENGKETRKFRVLAARICGYPKHFKGAVCGRWNWTLSSIGRVGVAMVRLGAFLECGVISPHFPAFPRFS